MNRKETDTAIRSTFMDAVNKAFEADTPVKIDEGSYVIATLDSERNERYVEVKVIVKAPNFNLADAVEDYATRLDERAEAKRILDGKRAEKVKAKEAKVKTKG